jgi:glycosyltransferase involved in cell wall biosynthesis
MKKKVLIFIEDGSYSYDSRVIREATALVEAGWDVTVISPKYSADPFYQRISDSLRAYYYPKPTTESLIGHMIEHGISLILGAFLTFWVFCRHGFSIMHACNPMDIVWMIALPYKVLRRKFIFDHHDLCPELLLSRGDAKKKGILYNVLLGLEAASFRVADVVIATNESYRDVAIVRGKKDPGKVFVVRNGPDLDRFRPVPPGQDPRFDGKVLIGYIGNMNLQDGVDYLVEAARVIVLERRRLDLLFIFIGGGSNQQRIASRAIELGLGNSVIFTGRIPEEQMLRTLCACDLCVQPDPLNPLNDKSTMNKAMEYMALRKPVVAFDLRETRVSCGDAALYASPNRIADLTAKILELVDNPKLRKELGQRGYERVNKSLAWNHSVPNLLRAYESALCPARRLVSGDERRRRAAQ